MPQETNIFSLPRPTITVAGNDNAKLVEGLLSMLIVENTSGLYRCEAMFGNWGEINNNIGFLHFDRSVLDFGKPFKVKLGTDTVFDGRITALEAHFPEGEAPQLNVLAEDRFQDLRMTRRTRTFMDSKDADVISKIASEHGLTANIDVTGPDYKVLAQINQSDLAFLRERARSIDAELWMDGSALHAQSHTARAGSTLEITYNEQLRSFSVLADLAEQRSSVSVSGWDVASKDVLQYTADESSVRGELNNGTSGASILVDKLGKRKESLVHTIPLSSDEAKAQAESYFKMSARRFVVGRGVADVNSQLRVGNQVNLKGLGPLFSGKYYLTEVMHLFDGVHGLRTEFTAERPGLGK